MSKFLNLASSLVASLALVFSASGAILSTTPGHADELVVECSDTGCSANCETSSSGCLYPCSGCGYQPDDYAWPPDYVCVCGGA